LFFIFHLYFCPEFILMISLEIGGFFKLGMIKFIIFS